MKRIVSLILPLVAAVSLSAQEYSWTAGKLDATRTGCIVPSKDNIADAIGKFDGKTYVSPNGSRFAANSSTAKVAKIVMNAQEKMARVKDVVGYSPAVMEKHYPESPLSNWYVDALIKQSEIVFGKKVHIGVGNFGGIRVDMPQGDIILDDILSMFPFKNSVVYIEHKGSVIRRILQEMAATRFQVLGGVRIVAEDGKLVSVEVDGEPLDDARIYGLVTNSFLLHGGDGLFLANDALSLTDTGVNLCDVMLDYLKAEATAGRQIVGSSDGRIIIRK